MIDDSWFKGYKIYVLRINSPKSNGLIVWADEFVNKFLEIKSCLKTSNTSCGVTTKQQKWEKNERKKC